MSKGGHDDRMINDPEIVFILEKYYDYCGLRRLNMKKLGWVIFIFAAIVLVVLFSRGPENPDRGDSGIWPEIKPFQTGMLRVSALHEIYYELCGNSKGIPVFMLHGGPGGSCSPYMRRFCDPEKFLIVLHDQRGCGRSKPYGELRENTTQDLVQDIERLKIHLGLEKIILFGGSWGTTLALVYAETFPGHVGALVLRGVFTATREEIDHFYHDGLNRFFPEAYDKLVRSLPDPSGRPLPDTLYELIRNGTPAEQKKYSMAWAAYELKASGLYLTDETVQNYLMHGNFYSFGLFENYYMSRACFLDEGQIMANIERIVHVPAVMVNGRYDVICPPVTAYRLCQKLPKSKLVIAERAGHWMGEKPIEKALIQAMDSLDLSLFLNAKKQQ
jgi:proline iminopeptidase